jgi:PAS domain S-box-containing protein
LSQGGLFESIFGTTAIGIAVEDLEGRPLFANPALCSLLGFTEAELRNKHCQEFSPPEDAERDWALFKELRQGSIDNYLLEKRFIRKDGTTFWGRLRISLMKNRAGPPSLVVAMVEDITEKKAAEADLQRSEASLQTLASRLIQAREEEQRRIAQELHDDLGQRVTLLAVGLEELRNRLAEAGQDISELASDLHRKADELATDIHNLSRHLYSPNLEFLGLHSALRRICENISVQQNISATLRAEELPTNLPPGLELCIFRVAQEALNNLIKHSHSSKAFVDLTSAGNTIVLRVKDLGIGFDSATANGGIGLSTMRERLRKFGGELFVESIPGKGTAIIAKVNLKRAKAATAGEC